MKDNLILKGFLAYSGLYLLIVLLMEQYAGLFKPFLLIFLIFAVYKIEYFRMRKTLLSALVFSWFGDVMLLFAGYSEMYFILGLLLFLISHLFYVKLFLKQRTDRNGFRKPLFWVACLFVLCYLVGIVWLLLPKLEDLQLPVVVYAIVISVMLAMALRVYFGSKKPMRYFFLAGAVSFVLSDTLLAIDKFYKPLPYASLLIMFTYLLAQFCFTYGVLGLNQKK